MYSRFCDDLGIGYATFDEQRMKRVRFDNFIPGFDRLQQFRVLLPDGVPECAIGRLEHLCAPDRDRKETVWAYKAPQASNCPVQIRHKENAEDAYHNIEGLIPKGKILEVGTAEFYVCQVALRSPYDSFVQEILREIDGHHMTA